MKRSVLILALVLASPLCFAQEAPNPFTSQNTRPRTGVFTTITSGTSAFIFSVMAPVQKMLNESLASMTRALKGSRSLGGLLLVAALALAYGIFHAAGPGHGKTIVSSFLLANEGKIRESFIIGYLVAAVHALSALTVVLVLYYVIRGIFATGVEQANYWIQLVTFAVITVIGAVMLVRRAAGKGHHHHGAATHHHGAHVDGIEAHEHGAEAHEHGAGDQPHGLSLRNLLGIALPAGVIPCPGAVAVVLFALSLHMLAVSILAVSSISVGMGTTISATGAVVILVKRGALRAVAGAHEKRDARFRRVIEIAGAAILFLFGLVFFLAQL
ncbi:MAG: nickel/cobalt transporter [Spirochaetia bacterium]